MRIFSRSALQACWKKHPDVEGPLKAWHHEVERASWQGPNDVRELYRTADFIANGRIIFNIGGNKYRLVVQVKYGPLFLVYVRFVGTHQEYNRIDVTKV